ncbi:MAG: heme o synthase [Anaerolineales bacterium]|nr:heme o synthase [Anaerolineales bacterium]
MSPAPDRSESISPVFRRMLVITATLAFALILLGVILRVTDASNTCLDWPTCSGGLTEPLNSPAFLPYIHRLLAALTGLGLFASLIYAWRHFRKIGWLVYPLILALVSMGLQIFLGRLIALQGEQPILSALHFALALAVLGLTLLVAVVAFSHAYNKPSAQVAHSEVKVRLTFNSPFARFSLWTLGAVMLLFVSGTLVSASGANAACQGWPLCSEIIPVDYLGWINLGHRVITLFTGLMVAGLFIQAWRTQRSQTGVLVATTAAGVLFFSQALMGIVETAQGYPGYLMGLHIVTAVAVWVAFIIQVSLVGYAKRTAQAENAEARLWKDRDPKILLKDYLMLTKPIVVALLLVTTFAGMVVGAQAWPSLQLVFWTLLGGFLAAGGSGAINQYIDRHDDDKMQRTANRPIPAGRLTAGEGLAFGVAAALASFYLMVAMVNFLAALLTLAGIIYYVVLYSMLLKKTTVQNIVIGGGAGAIPPLVGWAAATGSLNVPSLFLFAVVFMWTPPHFWALALVRKKDYARAGVPMLPVVRGEKETRWQIFLYTIELVILTLVLPLFGLGGGIYFVAAILLGGLLLISAWKVWRGEGNKVAWKMYRHSSMYLAFLFLALMVDALV